MQQSAKIVFKTWRDYGIARQANDGSMAGLTQPKDEIGIPTNYYLPVINLNAYTITDPTVFSSADLTEFNNIIFRNVTHCIIRRLSFPVGVDRFEFALFNPVSKAEKRFYLPYYAMTFRLKPRIMLSAAQYANIVTGWDSSDSIYATLAAQLKDIEKTISINPDLKLNEPFFPLTMNFLYQRTSTTPDSNFPYAILNTQSIFEIEYFWDDGAKIKNTGR